MIFQDSWFLLFLLLLPLYYKAGRNRPSLKFPSTASMKGLPVLLKVRLRYLPEILKITALTLIVIALARPQVTNLIRNISVRGTDIVLALDLSGSMLAEDFKPNNRLFAAKEVIKEFIQKRENDRIGLVGFAGEAFTLSPLTLDYEILPALIDSLDPGLIKDGTAIGMAIAEGTKRLKDSDAETKIIILLTDGENNSGNIDPVTAAGLSKALGIKIYTVGVGKIGGAPIPVMSPIFGKVYARDSSGNLILTKMNEEVLREVAETTNAEYYRAADKESLRRIYNEIDSLEKTDIKVKQLFTYTELYPYFLLAAIGFLFLSVLLKSTWLWSYP